MTLEDISQTFKALSDPIRLKIIFLLLERDSLCVCEIVDTLCLSQSTVSRHLAYLKNSGIVKSWREGVWMHYSLCPENLQSINLENLKLKLLETGEISLNTEKTNNSKMSCSIT